MSFLLNSNTFCDDVHFCNYTSFTFYPANDSVCHFRFISANLDTYADHVFRLYPQVGNSLPALNVSAWFCVGLVVISATVSLRPLPYFSEHFNISKFTPLLHFWHGLGNRGSYNARYPRQVDPLARCKCKQDSVGVRRIVVVPRDYGGASTVYRILLVYFWAIRNRSNSIRGLSVENVITDWLSRVFSWWCMMLFLITKITGIYFLGDQC